MNGKPMTGRERAALLQRFEADLAAIDSENLARLLLAEFDRRRLDEAGNPTDAPGLYRAAQTSMRALLGAIDEADPADVRLARNLAAVGRGVETRSKEGEDAPLIREIASFVETMMTSKTVAQEERAGRMAKTFSKRLKRNVDSSEIDKALRFTFPRRITEVALACGVFKKDATLGAAYWRKPDQRVRSALGLKKK
ncbi:MAG TPA: hypothetical protein VFQ35_09135 [Polyangiaceae bacterium]|nr:hypothetical protein [Polyangiaceae bacterium]